MSDLEGSVSKRETIYTKFSARGVNLKGKNEIRRKFLKKLNDKQINIKKIKIVIINYIILFITFKL